MRFTEEDGIITAEQAKERSLAGTEDSLVREDIREVMGSVKRSSFYGYRSTRIIGRRMMETLAYQHLKDFGYTITIEKSSWQPSAGCKPHYDWTINW